jgi:hypothetical protein
MWDRQSGRIGRLTIHASNWGMEMSPDGPVTSEFDWVVQTAPVDRYGTVPDEGAQWDLVMNGGLVNHGALDKPDWSSHT